MARRRTGTGRELYRKTTLRNGLRVVTERQPSVRSISLGVWVNVGSRNEAPEENGVTHLIEHMVFKGTRTRSAKQIASALESIGGMLNAFTSREQTCYTARVLDEHLPLAVDVLADITCNATLTPTNLKREKGVILEEIKESLETPSDYIHDLFAQAFWGKHPLGQPILGSPESVAGMPRSRIRRYIDRHYLTGSIVVAAAGSVSHDRLVRLVREKFTFPRGTADVGPPAQRDEAPVINEYTTGNNHTHICLGYPGLPYDHPGKFIALVLSAYLGGGMSSVLFQKIREDRGLAYSVYSYHDFFRDSGIFGVYAGTDGQRFEETIDVIAREFKRIKKRKIPSARLDQVREQLKGQLTIGLESTAARMNRLARQELMLGGFVPMSDSLEAVDRVTPADINEMANRILIDSQMAVAVLGPTKPSPVRQAR